MALKKNVATRNIEPQEIFGAAYGHLYFARRALKVYYKDRGKLPNIISPLATYSSFSVELFLKALVFLTTGEPSESEHDLVKLWNKLDTVHTDAMIELLGMPVGEFETCLEHHKNMFRTIRYNYELRNVQYNITFLANLAEVIGHYFVTVTKGQWEPPQELEFKFHSINKKGQLNRYLIGNNTALYQTFPSLHNHYHQITQSLCIDFQRGIVYPT